MKRNGLLLLLCLGLIGVTAFTAKEDDLEEEFAFTPLLTVDFESDKNGTDYRANVFSSSNGNDVWTRTNNADGPNNNTEHNYSGFLGSFWWNGEDINDNDNVLGDGASGYLMLKTLDVSAYQGGTVQVKALLGGNTGTIKRYEATDFLKFQYAFDSDIATGANAVGNVPTQANLTTGTYTTFGAFYGTGDGVATKTSSALINDADLDGDADFAGTSEIPATDVVTADSLKNAMAEWTFTFDVGATATKVSVLFLALTNGGSEEIAIDHIQVSAQAGVSAPSSATVAASVFLEGAYNGSNLNKTINGSIPSAQPYSGSSFNNHAGSESATPPANAVDWVLVELREAGSAATALNSTKVGSAAGFLMNDGTIKATDGTSNLTMNLSGNSGSDFYIVIYHRNHLPIMSAASQSATGTISIDFTSASATTYQTTAALSSLSGSKFGMVAGDADGDGDIDATDLSTWRTNNGGAFSYSGSGKADFNLDGVINAIDRNGFHQKNTSKTRQVPTT